MWGLSWVLCPTNTFPMSAVVSFSRGTFFLLDVLKESSPQRVPTILSKPLLQCREHSWKDRPTDYAAVKFPAVESKCIMYDLWLMSYDFWIETKCFLSFFRISKCKHEAILRDASRPECIYNFHYGNGVPAMFTS